MKSLVLVITLASCLVVAETTVKKAKKAIVAKTATTAPAVTAPTVAIPATTPAAVAMPTAPVASETAATVPAEIKNGDLKSIDQEITNAKMRAELGANKKYSFQASLGYSGGTVERPFSEVRPEIRAALDSVPEPAAINGDISVKYKMNANNSFGLGGGVTINTPFHGSYANNTMQNPVKESDTKEIERVAISNPAVSYTHARKLGDLQSVSSVELTYFTNSSDVNDLGKVANIGMSQTIAGDFSNLTAGAYVGLSKNLYKSGLSDDQKRSESIVYMYMSPFAEYAFNDKFSFRTVFNYFGWNIAAASVQGKVSASNPQQSMGLGMAITRDVYVYPNVQFMPFNVRSDLTNVALSTTINL